MMSSTGEKLQHWGDMETGSNVQHILEGHPELVLSSTHSGILQQTYI